MDNILTNYSPDIISCIANLSNDEIFTPPEVAKRMLDLLPIELWSNPNITFLDPSCKTGIFLREITTRLIKGLEDQIPDLQERVNHILTKQVFGIAITELTAEMSRRTVYCSKKANGKYSICNEFTNEQGNIRFVPIEHNWQGKHCIHCGASRNTLDRDTELESHAYEFIHKNVKDVFGNMKFDVIVTNSPYQLSDGGDKKENTRTRGGAIPIYHKFIQQAKLLNPKYITMIIPARWYSTGRGLDDFRKEMLNDRRIKVLVDYPNSKECFPDQEIKGGVCYFLWDRDYKGKCKVTNIMGEKSSTQKPFGMRTFYKGSANPTKDNILLHTNGNNTFIDYDEISINREWVNKYKVYITMAYGAGEGFPHQILNKPIFGDVNTACTETYLVIGPFETEIEAKNVIDYISTKFFRFLVMIRKNTQHAAQGVYAFVPNQDFSISWNDRMLYDKYQLTSEEIETIETMIKPMASFESTPVEDQDEEE